MNNILVIIPARGGSKGIPRKNIKPLAGKPLIYYTIDNARKITEDENICVSSDDDEIISIVERYGLKVPFKRPVELATDKAGTYEVLLHALNYYEQSGKHFDIVLLLQTTSPFCTYKHVEEALSLYRDDIDMVVSVKISSCNPYYNCFKENDEGFLSKVIETNSIIRRQDAPTTYEYNGAIYVINVKSLKKQHMHQFKKRIKYVMDEKSSLDLDTMNDWMIAEMIFKETL